ncbi:MAG TPA: hypothetical protein VLR94_04740 [Acidobacteriota bacterium]|nr:hypothetical protein [Acidobacteriota bacterium]
MRAYVAAVILLATCGLAQSADYSGTRSLFFGFSFANAELSGERSDYYGLGANLAVSLGQSKTAVVGDIGIQFRGGSNLWYFLGGVRQWFPENTANIFVEGLAGASYLNPKNGNSQTCAAYGGGGGIDWSLGDGFAIRAPQADILWGNRDGKSFHDFRIQAGASFRF